MTTTRARYIESLSLQQIENYLLELAASYPNWMDVQVAGESVEGRPVYLVAVTDKNVPHTNKQVPLIVSALHGNEKLGPAIILKLLEWLVTDEAESVRKNQLVLLFPCVNVDGYEAVTNINANGVDLKGDFDNLTQLEAKVVWDVVKRFTPDVVVDVHGNTGDLDYWCPQNLAARPAGGLEWDCDVLSKIAYVLDEESAKAGYPPNMGGGVEEVFPLPQRSYDEFHSLCLVVHGMPRPKDDLWDVRFKKLLEIGNERWPTEHYSGYPNSVIKHDPWSNTFLTSCGKTADERRQSRLELWKAREHITLMEGNPSERGMIIAFAATEEHPTTMNIRHGAGLRFRMPLGSKVTSLQINGREVALDGCEIWDGSYHTWLQTYMMTSPVERHPECKFACASAVLRYDL